MSKIFNPIISLPEFLKKIELVGLISERLVYSYIEFEQYEIKEMYNKFSNKLT